jgi:hypothetical protein
MMKEASKQKKKKSGKQVTFRESAARAFQDVLSTASRNNGDIALSIAGQIVVIEAKKLRTIIAHGDDERSIEREILQYAEAKHS